MATDSLVFSNARAKAIENTLLTGEKLTRMVFSESLHEGVKILYESNYGNSVSIGSPYEYEILLGVEQDNISQFLREAMPKGSGLECFLAQLDYHNAKALMKAKYLRIDDAEFMMMPEGLIDKAVLKEAIESDSYINLPKQMQNALRAIDFSFSQEGKSSRTIDVLLDKALYENIGEIIGKCKYKTVKEYFTTHINAMNISSFVRCRNLGLDENFFKQGFMPDGTITLSEFLSVYDNALDSLEELFKYKKDGKLLGLALASIKETGGLTKFEVEVDNALLDIFKRERNDIFSISPIAGLYCAKIIEIKVVRMVLVCLKNKMDKQIIKQRLREFYV